jgi:hypothetical protein
MDFEAGNVFNYKFGKLMEKHKIAKSLMFFHMGETDFNQVEIVIVGDPSIDWICVGADNLVKEMERRIEKNKIASGIPGFPEVPTDA